MEKMNWKVLNAAFWIELVLAYFMPFEVTDHFRYQVGFPIPFLSVYDGGFGINPFMSMHLNPIGLLADGMIIYLILCGCLKVYHKYRRGHISDCRNFHRRQ